MSAHKDGIWTIDAEGRTLFASDRMAEILGTTAAEMIGQPSFDFVFPEDVEAAQKMFQAKQHGDMDPFEFRIRRVDGSPILVRVQGTPMFDKDGTFTGIIGTFSEVRKRLARQSSADAAPGREDAKTQRTAH